MGIYTYFLSFFHFVIYERKRRISTILSRSIHPQNIHIVSNSNKPSLVNRGLKKAFLFQEVILVCCTRKDVKV